MKASEEIIARGYVKYSDFGAVGNGVADDYSALAEAHKFANEHRLPVVADEGAVYYIHVFEEPIEIKTSTDFTGAKFIIDDTGSEVFCHYNVPLFLVERDTAPTVYDREEINALFPGASIAEGASQIPWLKGKLGGKCLVRFYNEDHLDFVRFGGNVNTSKRSDCLLVNPDGSVDESTPIAFDFDQVTKIEIFSTDDEPITIQGGYFETIVCRVVEETGFENKWCGYNRKFKIKRPNTTLRDMTHRLVGEPDIPNEGYGRGEDGKLRQSYPYYGFVFFYNTYNSQAINLALNAHTTYYEDKPTASNPIAMGSYDLVIEYSSHVRCEGITNGVPLRDTRYWGIMSSNGAKNLELVNCSMSRFDAHCGFWNARLIGCTFGQTINVIGGGRLEIIDTVREGSSYFIVLRGDYGATFNGDILIKNCKHLGYKTYRGTPTDRKHENGMVLIYSGFPHGDERALNWDFGYTCYMPRSLYIENLELPFPEVTGVYSPLPDICFSDSLPRPYVKTGQITFKGMEPLAICRHEECTELNSIPVTVE
ncbi:MAG: hypothetical protein E7617_07345 [Ruminococcaceae bacterium]|nr:hypothetical protein [Oscillospiraceae bacterium]